MNKNAKKKEVKGIIIEHLSSLWFPAFDFLVRKEYEKEFEEYKDCFYQLDCPCVEEFLKDNKDYVYLGSEDLGHFKEEINNGIQQLIKELKKKGFKLIEKYC